MFTGFTDETVDFMWGIRFNNERAWFEAHKEIYLTHFYQPMREPVSYTHLDVYKRQEYDMLFTQDRPIIFAYHGYPTLIHELTYRRHNKHLHVRGYKEEGTITTPFDMRVRNDIDRFHLVMDTVKRLPQLGNSASYLIQEMKDKLVEHRQYITCLLYTSTAEQTKRRNSL